MDPIQIDTGPSVQDSENGYHRIQVDGEIFCGMLVEGKKEGMGSIRFRNGCEYHGMFSKDSLCGKGKFFFEDGSWFEGVFDSGCPSGYGYLMSCKGRFLVHYDGKRALQHGAQPTDAGIREAVQPFGQTHFRCLGVAAAQPNIATRDFTAAHYTHVNKFVGELVFARPPFADVPLWNVDEVRGRIAVVFRGPRASPVSFAHKQYHVQRARTHQRPLCTGPARTMLPRLPSSSANAHAAAAGFARADGSVRWRRGRRRAQSG
jgi:hypothetical protein